MIVTLRLILPADEEQLIRIANNKAVADGMTTLPIPFTTIDAQELIQRAASCDEVVRGIIDERSKKVCGVIIMRDFEKHHEQAELSIWIGEAYWGRGLGTAAIQEMVKTGFTELGLNRIYAYCMVRNVGSQRILEKSGFIREGLLRERVIKNGIYEDVYIYGILRRDINT
ncbi:GNAT family N-acetyltransferase [Bacteroidota bacterium]